MSTVSLMAPVPLVAWTVPVVPVAVQLSEVTIAGKLSLTVAPTTFEGPALLTVMVYVVGLPGVYVVDPSSLVIDRSDESVMAVVVLELLLSQTSPWPSHGSSVLEAALAVLPSGPAGVAASTVAVMTIVWLVEGGIVPSRIMVGQAPVCATVSSVQLVLVRAGSSWSYR